MKNIAVINAIGLGEIARRPIGGGESALDRVRKFWRSLPGAHEAVFLCSKTLGGGPEREVVRDSWSIGGLLAELERASVGSKDVFYFHADCPFLDPDLAHKMHDIHRKYLADYTFADGYPYGLATEIVRSDTLSRLRSLAAGREGQPVERDCLFSVIKTDINSFDIETEIAPSDLRLLRVSLTADTERNFLMARRVADKGGRDAATICGALQEFPEMLRTLPAYFPIQIVERCPHACSYCPYPVTAGDVVSKSGSMSIDTFRQIVAKIVGYAGDAVISVSLWGEPAFHPLIGEVIDAVLRQPTLRLVIETTGVGWQPGFFERIRKQQERQPTWIVSLDASREEVYRKLRGEGFSQAVRTAEELLALFPTTAYVQAVRMKENEDDLEAFFTHWKARTGNLIIQKYDSFSGLLPERSVADLSPLKRFPCWHIKRDLPVLLDGTVPLCREDLRVEHSLGNILREDLAAIWERGAAVYRSHIARDYPRICSGCDEYYTYNF